MALYYMNGKTFIEKYLKKEKNKTILNTQYILISSSIMHGNSNNKKIISGNNMFYPSQSLIMDYDDYDVNHNYQNAYIDFLRENSRGILATIILFAIDNPKYNIVFLCSEREKKYYYLNLIAKFVEDEFNVVINDYNAIIKKKEKLKEIKDPNEIKKFCKKTLNKMKKEKRKEDLSTDTGRKRIVNELSKSDLKKELKKRNLYSPGLDKSEMREILIEFID